MSDTTNYFTLYGLPESFYPDAAAVRRSYYALSREHHPDRFTGASQEAQETSLRMAALNNEAFLTLTDADRTMAYILKLYGVLETDEKYSLPPAFLMEMMELNEAVDDYEHDPTGRNKDAALGAFNDAYSEDEAATEPLLACFDNGDKSHELLAQIKDHYFRKKYLLRIRERLATFAAG